ncbi:MAG: DNA-directed RNA polymerase subunit alpha [Candidatus Daviesbacteria bacterium]|nr:MAG: DNA-directed RNA polymerase subunit alpha [Candidatus Daviesbacteria bacterium]
MFRIKVDTNKANFAKFILEPLEAGFGHTVGNSLRRTLLSALPGSAITSVKIDGVSHQFSTIEGVSEDVIEIILNLKRVRVKVFSASPIKLKLSVTGKKTVTAKDIEVLGDGEIVTKDAPIATITTDKGKLNIEMTAEKGLGYSKAEERKYNEIGIIPIDAIFSPVFAVNYNVEPTRVGRRSDFDRLILEVTTDGIMDPQVALEEGARILAAQFKQVFEPAEEEPEPVVSSKLSEEVLKMTIDELDLPVRISNALKAIDLNTVEDLINVQRAELMKAKNLGSKSLSLISEKLAERGLALSEA